MKITNYEIYKLRKAGLTNQQILTVLEYDETVDQELLLGDIAEISGCRNPAVFMERYFQIDDAQLEKEFQKFPSFSILDDCYPWDLSEIYDAPALLFYKGNLDLLKFPKVALVGSRSCSSQGAKSVQKVIQGLENELIVVSGLAKGIDTSFYLILPKDALGNQADKKIEEAKTNIEQEKSANALLGVLSSTRASLPNQQKAMADLAKSLRSDYQNARPLEQNPQKKVMQAVVDFLSYGYKFADEESKADFAELAKKLRKKRGVK